ncbi:MAG: nucleotidyltransferase domain-containing protein [Pseudomonadota bacterium]
MQSNDPGLERLLSAIVPALSPDAVYLFGSRARGERGPDSDYDPLVVVPDDTPRDRLEPMRTYALAREVGVAADIVACTKSGFERWKGHVGTLCYEAARFGALVYGR